MEKLKELIQNKKILAVILIVCVGILFITVFVSNRLGKSKQAEYGVVEASNTDSVKTAHIDVKPTEKNTEAEKKTKMELETDAQGNVSSVVTENGETIDLTSGEIETETKADGSVSYKLADGSEVVVNQDGTAKVNKKEDVSQTTASTSVKEISSVSVSHSSQIQENASSDKREENTKSQEENTEEVPPVSQNTQPSNNGQQQQTSEATTQQQVSKPVQKPSEQEPVQPTKPAEPQPTVCQHNSITKKVSKEATADSEGIWEKSCTSCGQVLETGSIHSYAAYEIDLGNGKSATIYGYYDNKVADEVYFRLNTYRQENGVNILERVFDEQSKIRVVECAYDFSHIRPNGGTPEDMHPYMFGENCGNARTGLDTAQAFMDGLKNSPGHNSNMLDSDCTMCGISVFHRMDFDEYGIPYSNMTFIVQNFGFEW